MASQKPREESVLRKRQQSITLKGADRLSKRIESIDLTTWRSVVTLAKAVSN